MIQPMVTVKHWWATTMRCCCKGYFNHSHFVFSTVRLSKSARETNIIPLMPSCTQEGDETVCVLRVALVSHHLFIGTVEGAVAAAGAASVAGWLASAVRPPPTQTHAAPEAR